jgi:hypothetical protein
VENQPIEGVDGLTGIASTLKPGQTVNLVVVDHRSGKVGAIEVEVR